MSDMTRLLEAVERGEPQAAADLIPLVYDELRRLAAYRLAQEKPGQTLQATGLVHEAYLRLLQADGPRWKDHRHFFNAAAEAMRKILVDSARRKASQKRGGGAKPLDVDRIELPMPQPTDDLLALNEALSRLEEDDPEAAKLVKLRFFAGLTMAQAADAIGVSPRTADNMWSYARAWLYRAMRNA